MSERATYGKIKPASAWAVVSAGEIVLWSVGWKRNDAIKEFTDAYGDPWPTLKRRYGLGVVRVTITPDPRP